MVSLSFLIVSVVKCSRNRRTRIDREFEGVPFSCISRKILLQTAPFYSGGHWICLDTAHTVASCAALVNAAQHAFPDSCSTAVIVGLAADKDIKGIVQCIALLNPSLVLCVEPDTCGLGARGQPAAEVSDAFHRALLHHSTQSSTRNNAECSASEALSIHTVNSMDEALREVDKWAHDMSEAARPNGNGAVPEERLHSDRAPLVCVTGSNYVVGAAIQSLQTQL